MWSKEKVWIVQVHQYHDEHYDDYDPDDEGAGEYIGSEDHCCRSYQDAVAALERFQRDGECAELLPDPEFREIWIDDNGF